MWNGHLHQLLGLLSMSGWSHQLAMSLLSLNQKKKLAMIMSKQTCYNWLNLFLEMNTKYSFFLDDPLNFSLILTGENSLALIKHKEG